MFQIIFDILKKTRPKLSEIIPNDFIDIHSHILPGIDDGAKNVNESIELISMMRDLGFIKIFGTPHTYPGLYDNDNKSIELSFKKINKKIKKKVDIKYASEYMIDESIMKKIDNKSILTLKKKYVLIEMSFFSKPNNLYEVIFNLIHNGYIPILAHPERYRFLHNNFKEYFKLKNYGCLFQLNLLSSNGYYGNDIVKISDKLLANNLIDFVGSDIHNKNQINYFKNKIQLREISKVEEVINKNRLLFM